MTAKAPQVKKRRILDTARRMLVQRGFQNIILDEIAREAGVAKGTLFLHYRSKEDLFAAVFTDLVDQLGSELDRVAASGLQGRGLLLETVRTILAHFDRNRDFTSHFAIERFPGCGNRVYGRLMERVARNRKTVVVILRRCAGEGAAFEDTEFAAIVLFGLCRSAMLYKAVHDKGRPLEARAPQVAGMFLNGAKGSR
jgi:AcrR family transcriptional regulator